MSQRPRSHSRHRQAPGRAGEQAARLYNEGVTLQAQGKITLAESAFRKALAMHPEFPEAHNNLGNVLLDQGKWKVAEKSFRRALDLLPDNAMLFGNIGKALHLQGKTDEALIELNKAIDLDPGCAPAINQLGSVLMELGKTDEALERYQQAHVLLPGSPEIATRMGEALQKLERYEEAVDILHATVKAHPRYFDAYPKLAEAALKIGAVDDAIKVLQEALKLAPENAALHARLAEIHFARLNFPEARAAISRAIGISPRNAAHYNQLGEILNRMNLTDEAIAMARKAIALRPDAADYHHSLGFALVMAGNYREARQSFRRAIRLQPDHAYALAMLADISRHRTHDEDMRTMETLLQAGDRPDKQVICLHFGLGKAFEDTGDYAQAFRHFAQGNALMKANSPYQKANSPYQSDAAKNYHTLARIFSRDYLQQHRGSGHCGVTPVFITGLPRSGKTVLETLLARHPQVTAGGESSELQQVSEGIVAARTGTGFPDGLRELETAVFAEIGQTYAEHLRQRLGQVDYATNTAPDITLYIGMIRLCLPDARVILCEREARDLCTEIYKKNLAPEYYYSHDPEELGEYYLLHRDLMDHWRRLLPDFIHVVQFEELLRDPENQVNALLDFCGLSREVDCLNTDSLPKTENSVGQWQHYREPLKPLFEILEAR